MTPVPHGSTTTLEAAVGEAAIATPKRGKTLSQELDARRDRISQALGKFADTDYFIQTVLIETHRNPDLLKCTPTSLMGAIMTAAQLRLEFGPTGLCYVLPRWSGKKKCFEAQFQMGYRGLISLSRRSGDVKDIGAFPVYENDQFRRWRDENGEHLLHEPHLGEDRGDIVRYYGHCIFNNGGSVVRVMELSDIARHRAFSESANSKYSPWQTNEMAMSLKTCIISMKAFLPLQPQDAQRLEADQQIVEERRDGETIIHRIDPVQEADTAALTAGQGSEILDALNAMESQAQRLECSRYLSEHFGVGASELSEAQVEEALGIVTSWPQAKEATQKVPEVVLSSVGEILAGLHPLNAERAHKALSDTYGHDYDPNDEAIMTWLEEWLDQPEGQGVSETTGEIGGPSDETLKATQTMIGNWDSATCNKTLTKFDLSTAGNLDSRRLRLVAHLAPLRELGDTEALELF